MKQQSKKCAVCKRKIGWLRQRKAGKQDRMNTILHPILQSQFCSIKCAKIGQEIMTEIRNAEDQETVRILEIIDSAMNMITEKRRSAIQQYGSLNELPIEEKFRLYPGAYNLLKRIREKILGEIKLDSLNSENAEEQH